MSHSFETSVSFVVDSGDLDSLHNLTSHPSLRRHFYHSFTTTSTKRSPDAYSSKVYRIPVAVSFRPPPAPSRNSHQILSPAQVARLRRALSLLAKDRHQSFILYVDGVYPNLVHVDVHTVYKAAEHFQRATAVMLDPPGTLMEKQGIDLKSLAEHAFAGCRDRRFLESYDHNAPRWRSLGKGDPSSLISAVARFHLTSHGAGGLRLGGARVALHPGLLNADLQFEQQHIDVICRFVFRSLSRCFSVLPACAGLAQSVAFARVDQVHSCAGEAEMVENADGIFIQFPSRGVAFQVRHVCGIVYHVLPTRRTLQPGASVAARHDLVLGQDSQNYESIAVRVAEADAQHDVHCHASPWTRDKVAAVFDQNGGLPWGDHRDQRWDVDFAPHCTAFKGFKLAVRNLQPFAVYEISTEKGTHTFYVDAFSIDSGHRDEKELIPFDPNPESFNELHGDLAAWEMVARVGLLDEIARKCKYELVRHRALVLPHLYIIEFARKTGKTKGEFPSEGLKSGVSGVLDVEEENRVDYRDMIAVSFKYVIHCSLNNKDLQGQSILHLYAEMENVNRKLNRGETCGKENLDWLMAAKVMQQQRRDGRYRWAATMGKVLAPTSRFEEERRESRRLLPSDMMKIWWRVLSDIVARDSHRLVSMIGGVVTMLLGGLNGDSGVITAGVTLIVSGLSTSTKKPVGGRRSATREIVMPSGCSFSEEGRSYGREVIAGGEVCTPLEIEVVERLGYEFKVDVAGNVMCITPDKEVRGCKIDANSVRLEVKSGTRVDLLVQDICLSRKLMVG